MNVGTELFGTAIHSFSRTPGPWSGGPHYEEQLKKEFVRNVGPALLRLEGHPHPQIMKEYREAATASVIGAAFLAVDGSFLKREDLLLAGDLLCELLPEDMPCSVGLLLRLRSATEAHSGSERNVSREEWIEFATRLARSDRPLVRAYGEYALVCIRRNIDGEVSEKLLADFRRAFASLGLDRFEDSGYEGYFRRVARDEVIGLESQLKHKRMLETNNPPPRDVSTVRDPTLPPTGAKQEPDATLVCERVRLKPLEIGLALKDGKRANLSEYRWRGAGGTSGWLGFVPAWKGTDVIYSAGSVLFVDVDRMAREVLVGQDLSIYSVVFDGRFIWAASGYDRGIFVISEEGEVVAHVTPDHGLPSAYVAMPVHVLEEGKILAAGSIGQAGRGWLATVSLV